MVGKKYSEYTTQFQPWSHLRKSAPNLVEALKHDKAERASAEKLRNHTAEGAILSSVHLITCIKRKSVIFFGSSKNNSLWLPGSVFIDIIRLRFKMKNLILHWLCVTLQTCTSIAGRQRVSNPALTQKTGDSCRKPSIHKSYIFLMAD